MSLPQNPFTSSSIPSMDTPSSSLLSNKKSKRIIVEKVDQISKLPDDVLLMILSKICTEDAVQTSVLSTRWKNVWKQVPFLCFDMNNTIKFWESVAEKSRFVAQLITKVINNHNGYLECCKIQHFPYQSNDGTLETWVQSLTKVKHTKCLALLNICGRRRRGASTVLQLSPNIFSHPSLTSLFLFRYDLEFSHAFNSCHNLTTLKLDKIFAEVGVFNTVIASCPSLKVLVLDITWNIQKGCLEINNNNLKLLHLACTYIDRIEVFAPLLDIICVQCIFVTRSNFLLTAPRILGLKEHYWIADGNIPHIGYNLSSDAQEGENIWHEFVVARDTYYLMSFKSLAVNVDMLNPREVNMLKEVLDAWTGEMRQLDIFFKHNNLPHEEGESSIGETQKKKLEEGNFFLNADFRVKVVWMDNFSGSNEKEFALASQFVTQGMVTKKLMIKTLSIPAKKKKEIQAAVTKLMKLPKGNKELTIECF